MWGGGDKNLNTERKKKSVLFINFILTIFTKNKNYTVDFSLQENIESLKIVCLDFNSKHYMYLLSWPRGFSIVKSFVPYFVPTLFILLYS